MEIKEIIENFYHSLKKIDFVQRYKKISETYNDFENRLSKMDKSKIKSIFLGIGYKVQLSSPGQYYLVEDNISDYNFTIMFQISGGIVTGYIFISYLESKVEIKHSNLGFIYRYLVGNPDAVITTPVFKDYDELGNILIKEMEIFQDFKKEFLSLINYDTSN